MLGLWLGCTIRKFAREIGDAMIRLLERAGVEFEVVDKSEICCGIPLIFSGFRDRAADHGREVAELLSSYEKVVVECPACYRAFTEFYPEMGLRIKASVLHFSVFALESLIAKLELRGDANELTVTFHDSCELGRHCGIYDSPREVIRRMPGVRFVELPLSRESSTCCGGGGLLRLLMPRLSAEIAAEKIRREIVPLGVRAVVTACPMCYLTLKEGAKFAGTDVEILDLPMLIERFAR